MDPLIQFPIPLKAMVFLKRLWEEIWKKTETPNIYYLYYTVHSEKRTMLMEAQKLFLDNYGWLDPNIRFLYEIIAEAKEEILKEVMERE